MAQATKSTSSAKTCDTCCAEIGINGCVCSSLQSFPRIEVAKVTKDYSIRFIPAHVSGYTQSHKKDRYEVLHNGYVCRDCETSQEAIAFIEMKISHK